MSREIRVRMYNVGFGDCFLIEFPRDSQPPFRVLIDCGAHSAGYPRDGWTPEETVGQILADVTMPESNQPRIDVIVASHRHQDHVSGFRAPAWAGVQVGEVWMPWTEPGNPQAAEIRNRQSRLALGLQKAFAAADFAMRQPDPGRAHSLREMVANSLTNASAMATLHGGFAGRPKRRFLSSDDPDSAEIRPDQCPGLVVHVLGPSTKPDVIRDMDPPAGQSYLRFLEQDGSATPAESRSAVTAIDRGQRPFSRSFTLAPPNFEARGVVLEEEIKRAARSVLRDEDLAVAVSLDKAVNGTSLMLMFEFEGAYLLFPGDAQWGTWQAVLQDPNRRDLVSKTTFYKVGHHGSHNATPVEFIEQVLEGTKMVAAATSVRGVTIWPEIPRLPMLEQLSERCDVVVRSDKPGRNRPGVGVRPNGIGVDLKVPCR